MLSNYFDMLKVRFVAVIVAAFSVIAAHWMYGSSAFIFLSPILLVFFFFFGASFIGNSMQAKSILGIEELQEPNFFFSRIYMAWLYANDRERWAEYTALFSYVIGGFFGSIFGLSISFSLGVDSSASLVSWILGMFITLMVATIIAKSENWIKTEETRQ
jgi:hypothetical protein